MKNNMEGNLGIDAFGAEQPEKGLVINKEDLAAASRHKLFYPKDPRSVKELALAHAREEDFLETMRELILKKEIEGEKSEKKPIGDPETRNKNIAEGKPWASRIPEASRIKLMAGKNDPRSVDEIAKDIWQINQKK